MHFAFASIYLAAVKLGRFLTAHASLEEWKPLAGVLKLALLLDKLHHTEFLQEPHHPEYLKDLVKAWQLLEKHPPDTEAALALLGQGVWGLLHAHPGEFNFSHAQEVWPTRPAIAAPTPAMSGPVEHPALS